MKSLVTLFCQLGTASISLALVCAGVFVWPGCRGPMQPVAYHYNVLAVEGGVTYSVDYGAVGDQVEFVVFQKSRIGKPVLANAINTTTYRNGEKRTTGWFEIPGEGRVEILKLQGGYEADDNGLRHHDISFTTSQLNDFLNRSGEWSFQAIEQFLKENASVKTGGKM